MDILWQHTQFLQSYAGGFEHWPLRASMKNRLTSAKRQATSLQKELSDLHFATTATNGQMDFDWQRLREKLGVFADLIEQAEKHLRSGGGRDRSPGLLNGKPTHPRPPQLLCAIIVASAWSAVQGEDVPHGNSEAQQAAAELWQAAGLVGQGDAVDTWKGWLRKAKLPDTGDNKIGSLAPWLAQQWRTFSLTVNKYP